MNLANRITFLRILFIPVFVIFLLYSHNKDSVHFRYVALLIFFVSILTDAIDGLIAQIRKEKTELGSFLDPLADKFLLATAFVLLVLMGEVPVWVAIVIISRDAILLIGWMVLCVFGQEGAAVIRPSALGKITTFLQMMTVLLLLLDVHHVYYSYIRYLMYTMIGVTITSTLTYVFEGGRRLDGGSS